MMRSTTSLVMVLALAACADGVTQPETSPAFGAGGPSVCATAPTFMVSDEASLHAAVAAAQPGDVIAIDGRIELNIGVYTETADITLTCASAGATLAFAPTPDDDVLVYAWGDRFVVRGLHLDATGGFYAVYSQRTDGQVTEHNRITCGSSCGFWVGASNAVVSDNIVTHPGGGASGLHFQAFVLSNGTTEGIDGTRIERNVVTALGAAAIPNFGGIRPRDGARVIVANNTVTGAWANSVSSVNLTDSELSHNVLEGAARHGLAMNIAGTANVVFSRGNVAIANRVRDAGTSGFLVRNACYNEFRGNPTLGSTPHAFILTASTGANTVTGTAGLSIDDGSFDCNGDGKVDPNKVSGKTVTSAATAVEVSAARSVQSASDVVVAETGRPVRAIVPMQ